MKHCSKRKVLGLVAGAALTAFAASAASAGAPPPDTRSDTLNHVCKGGPQRGDACDPTVANVCPQSECVLKLLKPKFAATISLIVDDNVATFDGTGESNGVHAVTVLLEFQKNGKHLLAQTYQAADPSAGPQMGDAASVSEATLKSAVDAAISGSTQSILTDLLFQGGDPHMSDSIRTLFGVPSDSTPVVLQEPGKPKGILFEDHSGNDALGSVLRVKVTIGFVAAAAP